MSWRPPRKEQEKKTPKIDLRVWKRPAKKATPEVLGAIVRDLALGLTRAQACAAAGVSPAALAQWEKRPEYQGLRAATEAARIKYILEKIEACDYSSGDWKRLKFFLEFAFPDQFVPGIAMAQQNNFFLDEQRSRELSERARRLLES